MLHSHKKNAFTILEILIVIVIIAILILAGRSYLNDDRQLKLAYGEQCINYVFGEIQKFKADIDYGNTTRLALSGGVQPTYYVLDMLQGFEAGLRGRNIRLAGGNDTNTTTADSNKTTYMTLSPTLGQCRNKKYAVLMTTGGSVPFDVLIPTSYYHDSPENYKITESHMDGMPSEIPTSRLPIYFDSKYTWVYLLNSPNLINMPNKLEKTFEVCTHAGLENTIYVKQPLSGCLEIAKLVVDRRSNQFYYFKCQKLNPNGTCGSRPAIQD